MHIDYFINVFNEHKNSNAIIWRGKEFTYRYLIKNIEKSQLLLADHGITPGMVVALKGDFSPNSIALLLSLIEKSCIIVPLTNKAIANEEKIFNIAQVECVFRVDKDDLIKTETVAIGSDNSFYKQLRENCRPGLVLFTSGTSGEPKAAVHDFLALLDKFKNKRRSLRTLNFLLFDHWGGLNTMFHILSNGGVNITTTDRSPENICVLVEKYKIELLPASPTFLNLLLLSGAFQNYKMDSLEIISYGTEPMPKNTLKRLTKNFPGVKLLQTYGLIELGVMRTKSERNDSLWLKISGEGYQTRIVDSVLQIKAESAMLGYINAPSPFTEDGWFITGDQVEEKGDYIKILGRKSEIINVGGEKVYPQEIENVIQEMENIAEVTVYGEKNTIIGNIVCANIRLINREDKKIFISRMKKYCKDFLKSFQIPVKIIIVNEKQFNERFKKIRK